MKRNFNSYELQGENDQSISTMANCLMLLSQGNNYTISPHHIDHHRHHLSSSLSSIAPSDRVFECKTCNRRFPSFQALGGHRASHKKPKIIGDNNNSSSNESNTPSPAKPKTHECSICGLEFSIGQALGGHMRRHRATTNNNIINNNDHQIMGHDDHEEEKQVMVPVVKRSNSRRVMLCLDLNLTPYENDLKLFKLAKSATVPVVDCFF